MLQPQFPHSGNDLNSRYRLFLHKLDDLKTLTVTSDHFCSVPYVAAPGVFLATILSGVQANVSSIDGGNRFDNNLLYNGNKQK